jgi:hypothetical protein
MLPPMTVVGQKHALPHRSIAVRFTPINRRYFGAPVGVDSVRSIGHRHTVGDIDRERIDGRQSAAGPRERQLTRDARELP